MDTIILFKKGKNRNSTEVLATCFQMSFLTNNYENSSILEIVEMFFFCFFFKDSGAQATENIPNEYVFCHIFLIKTYLKSDLISAVNYAS